MGMTRQQQIAYHIKHSGRLVGDTGMLFGMSNATVDDDPFFIIKGDEKRLALALAVFMTMDERAKRIVNDAIAITKLSPFQQDYKDAMIEKENA